MQLSDEQKQSLHEGLHKTVGDVPVWTIVSNLIPYAIRDPEGEASLQRVAISISGEAATELGDGADPHIPPEDYQTLHTILSHIKSMADPDGKNGIGRTSEVLFERDLQKARNTLISMIRATAISIAACSGHLRTSSTRKLAGEIIRMGGENGVQGIHGEKMLEQEERGMRDLQAAVFRAMVDDLTACKEILSVFDTLQDIIQQHRSVPDIERR